MTYYCLAYYYKERNGRYFMTAENRPTLYLIITQSLFSPISNPNQTHRPLQPHTLIDLTEPAKCCLTCLMVLCYAHWFLLDNGIVCRMVYKALSRYDKRMSIQSKEWVFGLYTCDRDKQDEIKRESINQARKVR